MALIDPSITDEVFGVKIDKVADTSADYASAANDTIIYNLQTKEIVKKSSQGNILPMFAENREFDVSFNEKTEAVMTFQTKTNVTAIVLDAGVATLQADINGGGFAPIVPPQVFNVGDRVTWQITYNGGFTLASINVKGNI